MKQGFALTLLLCAAVCRANDPPDHTVRLTVSPAVAPSPALRYPLLPELRDTTPGNAVLLYYRCFSPEWGTHRRPEVAKKFDAWRMDTSKKPSADLKWVLKDRALEELDRAARRSYCDWEMTERLRSEGIGLMLPDVQSMREYGSLIALRARFQMEAGDNDKVTHSIQTGMSLSRHIGDAPTLIQALVGVAICTATIEEIQRWIQNPGAPNLYWSLSTLPTPFVDLRKPLQGERLVMDALFPGLREAIKEKKPEPFPLARLQVLSAPLNLSIRKSLEDDDLPALGGKMALAVHAAKVYPAAKQALREQGWTDKELEALPITTAALMHEVIEYDRVYDDILKWSALPYPQAHEGMARAARQLLPEQGDRTGRTLARLLLPATDKVMNASVRTDRRIALLRCIEALRLHAAAHDGQLPEKLSDITEVPIPIDPRSGKSFEYKRQGDKALLHAPPFPGERAAPWNNDIKFEITIRK